MVGPTSSPASILEISGAYWRSAALQAGVMLEVFTHLKDEALTGPEVAERTGCEPRAMVMLLNALAAMGLLKKHGQVHQLGDEAREFLVKDSPRYVGFIIRHHQRLMESWARLPEAVRTGQPARARGGAGEEGREDFLLGMFNLASSIAPRVAGHINLSGRTRLLDLGGGPGTYAAHFCLANPGLRADIFDLPGSEPFARSVVERLGVADRVGFIPGDFLDDPIPGGYDAAWLSQVLHGEGPQNCQLILDKAARALNPGGLILIHEFMLNDAMDGPEFATLFSLNMLLGTESGQAYSEGQLRDMLARAGARDIERLDFHGPNDSGVLCGVVK